MSAVDLRHARLLQDARNAGVTVEDLARAWASMDGKRDAFDAGRDKSIQEDKTGHYLGYICETEEILRRATAYALDRRVERQE